MRARSSSFAPGQRSADQDRAAPDFLAGGGEMGAMMRAHDWTTTPFGPPESWPQSLRSATGIMLNSRYPIALYWGPALALVYNDAWSPILGGKHPWALGRPAREVWPEIWDAIGPLFEQVHATGEGTWSEDQLLPMRRHGYTEECYFNFTFSPIRGEGGGVEGVFNAVIETTERVLGERRLRTLSELGARVLEARHAEEACARAALIFEQNAADVPFALVYLLDAAGAEACLVASANVTPEHAVAAQPIDAAGGPAPAAWPLREVAETNETLVIQDESGLLGALAGGPWPEPIVEAVVLPLVAPGQARPTGFLVAGVSPRRRLDPQYRSFFDLAAGHVAQAVANARAYEAERRRAEALAELDRAKTAFFSNVSHEFRTPLPLMLGPLEEALRRPFLVGEDRDELTVAHRNGLRLLRLVNSLLDFSRVEAGRARAVYAATDLAALTADLASNFRSACDRAGLRLVVDCPPLPEPVHVDREMWEKVVLNLLSNAFKFTFEGEIAVAVRAEDGHAALIVRDTGTGIPAAELPRVFDRFHRVANARGRTHEGTGIGLALVQELVRLHGGTVEVASAYGAGTTFTVRVPFGTDHLPADRVGADGTQGSLATRAEAYVEEALRWLPGAGGDDPAPADVLPAAAPPAAAAELDRARVLLADDNADMRDYVRRLLSARYEVEVVADGQAALAAARARRPDLVLSDVMMPRLDGFGLLQALRDDPGLREVPIVLLSARAGEEAQVEGLEAGADDYLVKPFSARELVARVQTNLDMAKLRRQAAEAVRASEERFRKFSESTREGIAIHDGEVVLDCNESYARMFGYANVADVIGRPTSVFVAPEAFAAIRERNRTRDEQPYEALARRKDGSAFPAEFVGREIEWQGRRARVGVARDLTERKRAEDALRERENRLRLVTDAVPVLISFVDAEERYRFNNKAYEDWFGHKREEITGRTLREVLGDAAREALDPHVRAALAGERVRFESRVSYRDGGLRWIEADYVPKLSADGRVEGFYALVHDATARKEAEARQAFLLALGDRLRSLADPREVMASAAELLGQHLDAGCAGYSEVDGAGDHVTIERDWTAPGFASVAGIHRLDDYGPALIAELRAGRTVKIEDTAADPLTAGPIQQATYAAIATRAFVDAPLVKTGRLAAILYVLNRAPRVWADSEVALVEEVAERTWAAVERARAEAALRESERLLRAIGESSADCIYAKDRDGRMLYANPATLAVVGKTGDQVLGRHEAEWHDNPAEGDAIRANDRLVMESGVAQRLEEVFTTPGGAERIYQSTKSPMHDADGRIIGLVGVTTDVTERRRAEEAVRHSEARLTAFMENSPGSLFIKDAAGRYMVVNHAFLAGAGKPAEEVVGKTDADLFPPGMAAEFAAEDHAVRESGEPRRFEGTFEHAGRRRTFLSQKFPLPRGAVGCVGTDITERKLAEAALRESEARFRDMADNAPVMVWVTDPTGYCTYLGRSWYEFTGQTPENGLGHGWLDATHPDDREAAGAAFRAANERREAFRLEYRLRRKDGVYRWAIDAAAPAFGADGAFAGYIGSVIDITERKQAEESQLLLLEELNHRVKNTLAMVQSIAAQTLRFSEAPEGFPEAFQARLRALAQAHDLLTRSQWQGASLRELVDMTLDPHAGEQRVRVDGPGVALTPAVAVSLHLAFHELATNAAKYGALSVGGGSVDLNWRVVDGPGPALRIEWHETGGPPVLPPSRRGFGSRLIERGLAHELDGEVGIDFDHTGVRCCITIPLSQRIRAA